MKKKLIFKNFFAFFFVLDSLAPNPESPKSGEKEAVQLVNNEQINLFSDFAINFDEERRLSLERAQSAVKKDFSEKFYTSHQMEKLDEQLKIEERKHPIQDIEKVNNYLKFIAQKFGVDIGNFLSLDNSTKIMAAKKINRILKSSVSSPVISLKDAIAKVFVPDEVLPIWVSELPLYSMRDCDCEFDFSENFIQRLNISKLVLGSYENDFKSSKKDMTYLPDHQIRRILLDHRENKLKKYLSDLREMLISLGFFTPENYVEPKRLFKNNNIIEEIDRWKLLLLSVLQYTVQTGYDLKFSYGNGKFDYNDEQQTKDWVIAAKKAVDQVNFALKIFSTELKVINLQVFEKIIKKQINFYLNLPNSYDYTPFLDAFQRVCHSTDLLKDMKMTNVFVFDPLLEWFINSNLSVKNSIINCFYNIVECVEFIYPRRDEQSFSSIIQDFANQDRLNLIVFANNSAVVTQLNVDLQYKFSSSLNFGSVKDFNSVSKFVQCLAAWKKLFGNFRWIEVENGDSRSQLEANLSNIFKDVQVKFAQFVSRDLNLPNVDFYLDLYKEINFLINFGRQSGTITWYFSSGLPCCQTENREIISGTAENYEKLKNDNLKMVITRTATKINTDLNRDFRKFCEKQSICNCREGFNCYYDSEMFLLSLMTNGVEVLSEGSNAGHFNDFSDVKKMKNKYFQIINQGVQNHFSKLNQEIGQYFRVNFKMTSLEQYLACSTNLLFLLSYAKNGEKFDFVDENANIIAASALNCEFYNNFVKLINSTGEKYWNDFKNSVKMHLLSSMKMDDLKTYMRYAKHLHSLLKIVKNGQPITLVDRSLRPVLEDGVLRNKNLKKNLSDVFSYSEKYMESKKDIDFILEKLQTCQVAMRDKHCKIILQDGKSPLIASRDNLLLFSKEILHNTAKCLRSPVEE